MNNHNPYSPEFKIKTANAELYRVGPSTGTGPGASKPGWIVLQLLILTPKDTRSEQTIRDIKEQGVELQELNDLPLTTTDACILGWATVVAELLAGSDVETLMPRDFFRGFESAANLKKAKTSSDFSDAFRAKTRLGRWDLNMGVHDVIAAVIEVAAKMGDVGISKATGERVSEWGRPMVGPTDAELDVIEASPEPIGEQVTFPSLAELAAAAGADLELVDVEAPVSARPETMLERLQRLKRSIDGIVGVPYARKRRAETARNIRKLEKKVAAQPTETS